MCIKTQVLGHPHRDDNLHMRGWQIPVMLLTGASSQRKRLTGRKAPGRTEVTSWAMAPRARLLQPKPRQGNREDMGEARFPHDSLKHPKLA